jgi:hypothetical protein
VDRYHAIWDAGILRHEDHVELLEGALVQNPDKATVHPGSTIPSDYFYYRFSVPQYHALVERGILSDDDPVELLDGLLVRKMGKNAPHRIVKKLLYDMLQRIVPEGWYVDDQEPITLAESEPEPDLMIIRGEPRDHVPHPLPQSVGLVIEIADTTLQRDRDWKRRIYAESQLPCYWIVNLIDNTFEVYSDPVQGDYQSIATVRPGGTLPVVLDGQSVGDIDVSAALAWRR